MEGHFLRKELIVCVLFFCLLGSIIPSLASITDDQARSIDTKTLLVPASEITTSVSLCVFTRTGPVKQDIIVSSRQATELYQLLLHIEKEGSAHPFSARTRQLKQEFITALQATTSVSHEIIRAAKAVTPPAWTGVHPQLSICEKTPSAHLINTTNITRYLCSIGSEGVGSAFPPIMIPRPRIVCLWAGLSDSSTSIISFWPLGAATITGYQVGLAAGFIGVGAAFASPSSPSYVLYGYALMIRVSGEHIEEFP
jgi:hypothetical protein